MKQYGFNKSTEFTKKQIGVIYRKAKTGELKVEQCVMTSFYNLADYYGYDDNRSVEEAEREILMILENVFSENLEEAQERIDRYTKNNFELLSRKNQESANRELVK